MGCKCDGRLVQAPPSDASRLACCEMFFQCMFSFCGGRNFVSGHLCCKENLEPPSSAEDLEVKVRNRTQNFLRSSKNLEVSSSSEYSELELVVFSYTLESPSYVENVEPPSSCFHSSLQPHVLAQALGGSATCAADVATQRTDVQALVLRFCVQLLLERGATSWSPAQNRTS